MKTLLSSTTVRLAGLTALAAVLSFSPASSTEALTPECEVVAGCQICKNNHCEFVICDDFHRTECSNDA